MYNTMYHVILNLGLTFAVLIIRSLDNHECHKIYPTLTKCFKRTGRRTCLLIHLKTDTLSESALLHYKTTHLFTILDTSYSQIVVLIINFKTIICVWPEYSSSSFDRRIFALSVSHRFCSNTTHKHLFECITTYVCMVIFKTSKP